MALHMPRRADDVSKKSLNAVIFHLLPIPRRATATKITSAAAKAAASTKTSAPKTTASRRYC
jgi:hypothetical protein